MLKHNSPILRLKIQSICIIIFILIATSGLKYFNLENIYIFNIIILVLSILYYYKKGKDSILSMLTDDRPVLQQILLSICIYTILLIVGSLSVFVYAEIMDTDFMEQLSQAYALRSLNLYNVVIYFFLIGFAEEFFFRGYVLEKAKLISSRGTSMILISSLVFGLEHMEPRSISGSVFTAIFAFCVGILFSSIRINMKNGTLLTLGIAHGLYNMAPNILTKLINF